MPSHIPTHTITHTKTHAPNHGSIAGVSRDSTSNIYVPANSTEWTAFLTASGLLSLGVPNSVWGCQEVAGNLADSVGSLVLTAASAPLYQQTVAGWSRKGVGTNGNARFTTAAATGPDPSTTSQLWCLFTDCPYAVGNRNLICISDNAGGQARLATTNLNRFIVCIAAQSNGALATGSSGPHALGYNRTAGTFKAYLPSEKITGTYSAAVLDGNKGMGQIAGAASAQQSVVYGFMYSGANAEMSDASFKSLLTAMGYTIPWT